MRYSTRGRSILSVMLLFLLSISGCGGCGNQPPGPQAAIDGMPPASIDEALEAHYAGLGHMERYEYADAAARFREVRTLAPDWQPGKINLAIALLNQTGEAIADSGEVGGGPSPDGGQTRFEEAISLLDEVLAEDPGNLHAHYCKGIILEQVGRWEEAHEEFAAVVEDDPNDAHALYWSAVTMPDDSGVERAALTDPEKLVEPLERALAINPYLVPALYNLSRSYIRLGRRDDYDRLTDLKNRLDPQRSEPPPGIGDTAAKVYGEMGQYADVFGPPSRRRSSDEKDSTPPPIFDAFQVAEVALPEGHRWASSDDFSGDLEVIGRARARFGAGVSAFDVDRDGKLDLYITAAVVGPAGVRDVLLRNLGDGKFEDVSEAFGIPADRASIGVAAADFDADFFPDLYLTGIGPNLLLRNTGEGRFEDITAETGTDGGDAVSITARWLDLDLDGDLDLFVVNHCEALAADRAFTAEEVGGAFTVAYRNDGQPVPQETGTPLSFAPLAVEGPKANAVAGLVVSFSIWSDAESLQDAEVPHSAIAALDFEGDRDLDLILAADGQPLRLVLNDRLGQFRAIELEAPGLPDRVSGLLVSDFDQDGRPDLLATTADGRSVAWRNASKGRGAALEPILEPFPIDATGWRSATLADLDLDGFPDLIATSTVGIEPPAWTRNEGDRLAGLPVPAAPPGEGVSAPILGGVYVPLTEATPLPDLLLVRDGAPPILASNQGNGNRWLGIDLAGKWNIYPELMRTNPHGLGTSLSLEGANLSVHHHHSTIEAGTGQSIAPFVLGLGDAELVPLIRLRWPDGVMQTELNQAADVTITLAEKNRKTGSCPVLFTWNGERFVCIGDILGGGGMGYLVAPGVYSQPDRDEMVHITDEQLTEEQGVYRISISEPMDEVAYLDHLVLDVVDRPPGVEAHPDERFAPGGNRPSGELFAWKETIALESATDLDVNDVTDLLSARDRRTVDTFKKYVRWIGYAEEHGIILDFGDRLSRFGPEDRLVLCMAGWVEYPYSQTNYAASTAGVALQPPVLERLRDDDTWEIIEPDPGYPAGLPRMTTLDLTGKLTGDRCVLRIRTNMECYWDHAFIALRDPEAEKALRVTSLPISRARLGPRGYTREVSPDGRLPLLYDYDYVDPAPLAPFAGKLTRFGDVTELLTADDDLLCLVGPGDEVRIEFDATAPDLPNGWTRSYVLRSYGYCKDADPFTAGSDTVGPLPWKGMPEYPFAPGVERDLDPAYQRYLETYQTRIAGGD